MKTTKTLEKLICIILLLQWAGWTEVQSAPLDNTYYFSNLSLKDGLSQLSVLKIYQDSKGYMWFATRNGLNKYDGNRMVVYKHSDVDSLSLADNHVTAMVEDRKHCLWVGTSHGLNRLDLKTDRITPYAGKRFPLLDSGVRSLFVDSNDRLWVGTSKGLYLFVPEADTFRPVDLEGRIKGEFISAITETSAHQLLIGTEHQGLYVCDLNMRLIGHYARTEGNGSLTDNNISDIYEDSRKQLWVSTNYGGVSKVDLSAGTAVHYTTANSELTTDNIRCLAEADGTLFIGTFEGLYTIDLASNRLKGCFNAALEKGTLSHFSIYSICVDNSSNVWVGTYSGGVNYFSKYNNRFVFHEPTNALNMLMGVYGAMVCQPPHCLYIATEGGGLLDYHLESDTYHYYLYDTSSTQQYSRNIIKSIMQEGNYIWCGTAQGSIYRFDTRSKRFSLYYTFPSHQSTSVYSILHAQDGCLWLATSKPEVGLVKLTEDKQMQNHFELAGSESAWSPGSSRCLLELEKGVLLIGSRNKGLYKYDENKREYAVFSENGTGTNHLPADYVTSIVRTKSGQIWVSTFGGGLSLFDREKGIVRHVTKKEGLQDDEIYMVVEDRNGDLWMSANSCISRYSPKTDEVYNYHLDNGMGVQEFSPHSGMLLPDGNICFSTNNGFITFDPANLQINSFLPPLVLTMLLVNNQAVHPAEKGILQMVLDDTEKIELDYNQNNIAIGYCALNYVCSDLNQYAYRLRGYDSDWNYVGNRQEAYYTNLESGKYVFEVKASNNDGVWNDEVRTISIVVRPPYWKTWYAYLFYTISFFGICFLVMYYIIKKKNLEQALVYEHLKQQQAEEFHQTKMRMFTNFSHELRTPLTLIISPLQELLQRNEFNTGVRNKLSLIYNNSQRLLLLVNQLMDLRKNQAGKMQLKIAKDDICSTFP